MPGTRCAVAICNNSLQVTKAKNLNVLYHTFPKDAKRQKLWIKACHRKDIWNPRTSVVCSDHFNEDDFESDLRTSLMNIRTKRTLKSSAIPSRNCTNKANKLSMTNSQCIKQESNTELVESLISEMEVADSDDMKIEILNFEVSSNLQKQFEDMQENYKDLQNKYQTLKQSCNEQQNKIKTLEKQLSDLQSTKIVLKILKI